MIKNKSVLKGTSVGMFGYDISEHEAIKSGIIHDRDAASALALSKLLLQVSRLANGIHLIAI